MAIIACVIAHPDDEAFGPGGTIAKLSPNNDVYIICATDGDSGTGLKNIRHKELLASAKVLGVKQVFFLNFVDGELSNNKYQKIASGIQKLLDRLQPETVITFHPNGVSGHLDHIAVTSVINFLFPKLNYLKKVMYFCMRDVERDLIPGYFVYMPPGVPEGQIDEVVDTSDVWETKIRAVHCHKSQQHDIDNILSLFANLPKQEYFLVKIK